MDREFGVMKKGKLALLRKEITKNNNNIELIRKENGKFGLER